MILPLALALILALAPVAYAATDSYTSLDDFKLWDENGQLIWGDRAATGENGVVSASRYEASKIGIEILKNGGNAVDAAVAVGFALGLVDPCMIGPGGGGFMTLYNAKTGETKFINYREVAPAAATPEMWVMGEDGKVVGNQKVVGGKSQGVPGFVAGMLHALENYGTMERKDVMQPTIDLARKGYTVTPFLLSILDSATERMMMFPEFGKLYLKEDGFPYTLGEIIKNPDYANTLEIIRDKGVDGFYKGEIAEAVIAANNKYDGVMTMEDLQNYKVTELEPVKGSYRGYDIISSPPPSSGGTVVIEILNILENFDLPSMKAGSAEETHLIAEAFDLAYTDRNKYMGDPNYVDVPIEGMINRDYAKLLSEQIDPQKATTYAEGATPWDYEHPQTTHFSIADKEGNMVAVTFTINYGFGSGVAVDGYGFLMNNQMDDFVTGPDHPNSIAGGKVPLSSMSPTVVLKDGKPAFVTGSPGGITIIATVAQMISNIIDHGLSVEEATLKPRIAWAGENKISYESRFDPAIIEQLRAMGHECVETSIIGISASIAYKPDGTMEGSSDPRADGKALGF